MIQYFIVLCLVGVWAGVARGEAHSRLSDEVLTRIQFDQNIGSQVSPALGFTDETGKKVHLGDYFGDKPTVLILGYYGCPMLCTLVLNGAAECFRDMTWKPGQQFNVVFVSINPDENPTLAARKKNSYMQGYGNGCASSWHFLTGAQDSITNLAAEVGFRYAYDPAIQQYAHPSGLVILTGQGKVARYLFGINFDPRDLDSALRAAGANVSGAPQPQFTLLCFHYSPIHGKYGPLIMDVVRVSALLVVFLLAALLFLPPRPAGTAKPK